MSWTFPFVCRRTLRSPQNASERHWQNLMLDYALSFAIAAFDSFQAQHTLLPQDLRYLKALTESFYAQKLQAILGIVPYDEAGFVSFTSLWTAQVEANFRPLCFMYLLLPAFL